MEIAARLSHGRAQLCGTAIGIRKEEWLRTFRSHRYKSQTDIAGLTRSAFARIRLELFDTDGEVAANFLFASGEKARRAHYQQLRYFTLPTNSSSLVESYGSGCAVQKHAATLGPHNEQLHHFSPLRQFVDPWQQI